MSRSKLVYLYLAVMVKLLLVHCSTEEATDAADEQCKEDISYYDKDARCGAPRGTYPLSWVPSNVTELEEYCSLANNYFPCFLKWDFKCKEYEGMRWRLGGILDACATGSSTHEGLKENIECIYRRYRMYKDGKVSCKSSSSDIFNEYEKFEETNKADLYPELSDRDSFTIGLMIWLFDDLGCFLSNLECPQEAEEGILEIYVKIHSWLYADVQRLKDKMFEIMDHLPMDDERKTVVKDTSEKFENKCQEVNCIDYEDNLRKLYYE